MGSIWDGFENDLKRLFEKGVEKGFGKGFKGLWNKGCENGFENAFENRVQRGNNLDFVIPHPSNSVEFRCLTWDV